MAGLTIGVLGESAKENEQRLPLHPLHFDRIAADLRGAITLEHQYGVAFDVADNDLADLVAGFATRAELFESCDVILQPKPTMADIDDLRPGQVLWGWPHCVQDFTLTQRAIDKRLTLIAWEAMHHWNPDGSLGSHVFQLNNELAGYASTLQAMALRGITGGYGRRRRAVVLAFGSTARGAVAALLSQGVHEVVVLTMRDVQAVAARIPGVVFGGIRRDETDPSRVVVLKHTGAVPAAEYLSGFDIVVNCVLQDTDRPLMFVSGAERELFAPGTLIVDVSCDEGMGFDFARPTSFEEPMLLFQRGLHYYAVDHSPSYLWESATWVNSEALIPHLGPVLAGPEGWDASATISRAIEIRDGVIQNPKILTFQRRREQYPHEPIG